jgi:RNA polymerase sigma-70 factor, ECF subfamily
MEDATVIPRPSTAEVFQEFGGFAWRVLRRLGVRDEDVDDVLQEVFVTVHRKLPGFEGRSSVRTWLYGICVRVASEYRKRTRARRETPSELAAETAIDAGQEDHVAVAQARAILDGILDGLDDAKRAVFVLYEIEGLPMGEVAVALDCPLQTAYSRLHVARREVEAAVERLREQGRSL